MSTSSPPRGPFSKGAVETICRAIGESDTGSVLARLLAECRLPDPGEMTKWKRLHGAVMTEQRRTGYGTPLLTLVKGTMRPERFIGRKAMFDDLRSDLNEALAFYGLEVRSTGAIHRRGIAATLDEAAVRSRRISDELRRRNAHSEVFRYCTKDLVAEDLFNAVLEATKGLCERVRQLSGSSEDGAKLIREAFEQKPPVLALNTLRTETELNEQRGMASLMHGVVAAFRNPLSHEPKILFPVSEPDALDVFCTISLIHRRLDRAVLVPVAGTGAAPKP